MQIFCLARKKCGVLTFYLGAGIVNPPYSTTCLTWFFLFSVTPLIWLQLQEFAAVTSVLLILSIHAEVHIKLADSQT